MWALGLHTLVHLTQHWHKLFKDLLDSTPSQLKGSLLMLSHTSIGHQIQPRPCSPTLQVIALREPEHLSS